MKKQSYHLLTIASLTFLQVCITVTCYAQFSVSPNKRFLLKHDKPFFWLGDTAWELFHALDSADADTYLKKRSGQGFTVIQAVVLAELDGLNTPNANGDKPLIDNDPAKPNERYFAHVDYIIDKAASYNLSIALLPTWGDKLAKERWGKGPEIFNDSTADVYAKWIATRYKDRKNIIWILGGDRIPRNETDVNVWRTMGKAIMKATANKAIITFHPQPNEKGSAEWYHNDSWLAFNMFQTGHCRDAAVYDKITGVYNMSPVKPVIDGEPIYEDHPVCFNAKDLGTSNAYDVRRAAYLSLFAGSFGHTYGCHDIWQMYSATREAINGPHMFWSEAVDLPGATQMKHVRTLFESFPITDRVPDQSLIKENNLVSSERIQATRGADYLMVYSAAGRPFTVSLGRVGGRQLKGYWYDPKTGKKSILEAMENKGTRAFKPATSGYGQDWVLVLYNAEKDFDKAAVIAGR
ncbi:MAG: DUF4038 domain-containing protein [Sphingobacteriales bacterium]|nr:MAG: DUF4038 domain-containing protein [Sphingobacteriales bacterium]